MKTPLPNKPILLRTKPVLAERWYVYRLASQAVWIDRAFDVMNAYFSGEKSAPALSDFSHIESLDKTSQNKTNYYNGEVFALGELRSVSASETADELFLVMTVSRAGDLHDVKITVAKTGGYSCIDADSAEKSDLTELVLGPMLINCLALRNTFCLHASAAVVGGSTCLFLGDSGVGKSTIVGKPGQGWQYVADDIVPVEMAESLAYALPHLPQLKKELEQQYPATNPERCAIREIFILQRDDNLHTPLVETCTEADKLLALVRHTASARLFAPAQRKAQMKFMKNLSRSVNVRLVRYAHSGSSDNLKRSIETVLGTKDHRLQQRSA